MFYQRNVELRSKRLRTWPLVNNIY